MKNLIKKIWLYGYEKILRFCQWYMRNYKQKELVQIVCLANMSTEEWIQLEMKDKEIEINEKLNIK